MKIGIKSAYRLQDNFLMFYVYDNKRELQKHTLEFITSGAMDGYSSNYIYKGWFNVL